MGEKDTAKNLVENDKKSSVEPCQVGEREESLKKCFEWVKHCFFLKKKLDSRCSINWKQVWSIKLGRGSLKFLNAISIDRKTDLIDQNCKKKWIFENQ